MPLANFGQIIDFTKVRCKTGDITDYDEVISRGINQAYLELKKKYPTVSPATIINSVDNVINLPSDCMDIIKITPDLYADEYRLGDNIILQRNDTFTLIYSMRPATLEINTDIPLLNSRFFYALSTYGCYAFFNHKKKYDDAKVYLQEYYDEVRALEPDDMLQHQVQNVYSSLTNEVNTWQGF